MNEHFRPVALEHASRLINHGPTVLVTSAAGARRNVMAAAWSMPVEFTPPRIAVVIDKRTFTRELVIASGAFGLCLPGTSLIDLTYAVGGESGREVDKFERHQIDARPGTLGMPLIEAGCAAWLECRLIREPHAEDAYDTCFGEVIAAAADSRVFANGRWRFDDSNRELQTIHHLGGGNFVIAGGAVAARSLKGAGAPAPDSASPEADAPTASRTPQATPSKHEYRLANSNDFAALARMLELYQHDLSDVWDQDVDASGAYGFDLSRHARAERFFAHVALVDGHYAGVALVAPAIVTQTDGCWMEQFFVMKKYRRCGVGRALATHVLDSHPGPWEIGQMPANVAATRFWRAVIGRLTAGRFGEVQVTQGWWHGTVQRFVHPAGAS